MQPHSVVDVNDEVGDVTRRFSLIDVVALADSLHFMPRHASTTLSPWVPIICKTASLKLASKTLRVNVVIFADHLISTNRRVQIQ